MSQPRQLIVDLTTDAAGAATEYSDLAVGPIRTVSYIKDGTTPFDNGVDFTITLENTGQSVLAVTNVNASAQYAPRQPTHDQSGVASLYAAAGEPVEDYIWAAADRIKVVVAQGGNTKNGRIVITVG